MWKFFRPSSFPIIQPLFQPVDYDFVNSFSLSITLEVSRSGIPVCNSQVTAVSPEGLTIKLKAVVLDEGVGDPKSSNNVLPDKLLGVHIPDIGQGLGFDPFGEIVHVNQ